MIRFTAYDTIYFQGEPFEGLHKKADSQNSDQVTELMVRISMLYQKYQKELADYNSGKITEKPNPPVNRAYSRVVGWTGLWHKEELISMSEGRTLMPLVLQGQPQGLPSPSQVIAKGLPTPFYYPQDGSPPKAKVDLGPMNIGVVENGGEIERITVDMGTTMPERDSSGAKANFGQVQLRIIDMGCSSQTAYDIATLPNDIYSYQKTSGVFDITDLSDEVKGLIPNNPFALYVDSYDHESGEQTSTLALIENPVMSNTNSRGVYVNQPDPYWGGHPDSEFTIKVQHYGKPPAEGAVQLSISQCDFWYFSHTSVILIIRLRGSYKGHLLSILIMLFGLYLLIISWQKSLNYG